MHVEMTDIAKLDEEVSVRWMLSVLVEIRDLLERADKRGAKIMDAQEDITEVMAGLKQAAKDIEAEAANL